MSHTPTPPTLLIVDDNADNRDMLARRLRRLGYPAPLEAEDGVDALERLRAEFAAGRSVDVILLDIMMPRMSGIEFLEIVSRDPDLRRIPVLVISADSGLESVVRCIELGAEDHLPKPFNPTILRARLGSVVEKKRLRDEVGRQLARLEAEVLDARRQQLSMLPEEFPDGGPDHPVSIHALMHPAREVGGDFYDCFVAAPDVICFGIGDVSGKGMSAALFMARSRSLLRATVLQHVAHAGRVPAPSELVRVMNEELCKNNPLCMFVTLLVGFLDAADGTIAYVNAGHVRPWVIDSDGLPREIAGPADPPLGVMPDLDHRDHTLHLGPEETLVALTDGLPEMTDPAGDFYTLERFASDLADIAHQTPAEMTVDLAGRAQAFAAGAPAADDVTILVLRRHRRADLAATTAQGEFRNN